LQHNVVKEKVGAWCLSRKKKKKEVARKRKGVFAGCQSPEKKNRMEGKEGKGAPDPLKLNKRTSGLRSP